MKDLTTTITLKRSISPVSVADNTPQVGQIIDHQGFNSVTYVIATGSLADADATFVVLLQHGDDPGEMGFAVDDAELIGTETLAGFQFDDDNECRKLGYKGAKRYTRLTITPVNNSSAALICAFAVLGHAEQAPTANPPA